MNLFTVMYICVLSDPQDLDEVEDVQLDVMFTIGSASDESPDQTARDIIDITDITDETMATQSVFKSVTVGNHDKRKQTTLQKVKVKGTSDHGDQSVSDSPRIVPQVTQAIKEFSRKLTGNDLDEMLEGGLANHDQGKASNNNKIDTSKTEKSPKNKLTHKDKSVTSRSKSKDRDDVAVLTNNNNVQKDDSDQVKCNKVIRHSEGFKAPRETAKCVQNKSPQKKDEEEIDDMIDDIMKATPDPSLTLSWRSRSEVSSHPNYGGISPANSKSRDALERALSESQNRSFKEIPNSASRDKELDISVVDDDDEKDFESLQKLVNAYKNTSLQISESLDKGEGYASANQKPAPRGKPPVAPKPLSSGMQPMVQPIKSPRFVRKHDSLKGRQVKVIMTKVS